MSADESNCSNVKKESNCCLLTFGNFELILSLNLSQEDVQNYNIDKQILETLDDISFLENNKKLWSKINLTSNDDSLNSLITMYKMKKGKNLTKYILFDEINYNDTNFDFSPILEHVMKSYGIIIKSVQGGQCKINIGFKLKYEEKENMIAICGEIQSNEEENENNDENNNNNETNNENNNDNNNDNNNENNNDNNNENNNDKNNENNNNKEEDNSEDEEDENEEDRDDIGSFSKIFEEEENLDQYKYIYLNVPDIISGKFSDMTFKQLYNFLFKIKEETNIKIILFLGNEFKKGKDLFKLIKVSDIHIFSNKNKLLELLKKNKEKEEKKSQKEKGEKYKTIKTEKNNNNNSSMNGEEEENKTIENNEEEVLSKKLKKSQTEQKDNLNLSMSSRRLAPIDPFNNKSLNKKNMFSYLRNFIYNDKNGHPNLNEKLGIYYDEFNKIIFVNYQKNNMQPSVNEYDLLLLPKPSVYNLKEIEATKKKLKENESKYISVLLSGTLNQIINSKEEMNSTSYYLATISCGYVLKKLLLCDMNDLEAPINKSFYSIKIKKEELKSFLDQQESEKRENGFNMDFGTKKAYLPLRDKYLRSYMQSPPNIDVLKSNDFINTRKKILIERVMSPREKKMLENNEEFLQFMNQKNIKDRNQDYMQEFLKRKKESNYYIPGVDGIKEYYMYLGKNFKNKIVLPAIKKSQKQIKKKKPKVVTKEFVNRAKVDETKEDELKDNAYGVGVGGDETKKDTTEYKEIKFQGTPEK